MPKGKQAFKQRDYERAIRGAQKMGLSIGAVTVDPHTGKITITPAAAGAPDRNEWDESEDK